MRIVKALFLMMLFIGAAFALYKYDLYAVKEQNKQAVSQEKSHEEFKETVSKVDDAAIIRKALKHVGVLSVLEGMEEYKQLIEEEKWYSYRGINIDWHYRFAIAYNLQDVLVSSKEGVVDFTLDEKKLYLQFVEKTRESTSHSEASWLAEKYSSQEITALEKEVLDKIRVKIYSNPQYWESAAKSLQNNLTKICSDLGYTHLNFISKDRPAGWKDGTDPIKD